MKLFATFIIGGLAAIVFILGSYKIQSVTELRRIMASVTMLEEEVYKAEICTYLARNTGATIVLLRANDYGSHAQQNQSPRRPLLPLRLRVFASWSGIKYVAIVTEVLLIALVL